MSDHASKPAVSREQVLATAALARIDLTQTYAGTSSPEQAEEEITRMAEQINTVIGYMDILNSVDTAGVEPLYSPMLNVAEPREDVARKLLTAEEILANAPKKQGTFFVVPPAI